MRDQGGAQRKDSVPSAAAGNTEDGSNFLLDCPKNTLLKTELHSNVENEDFSDYTEKE